MIKNRKIFKNKKTIYSLFFTSIVVTSSFFGTTYLVLDNIKNEENYIEFHLGKSKKVIGEDTFTKIIDLKSENTSATRAATKEFEANLITSMFFELALSGEVSEDFDGDGSITNDEKLTSEYNPILLPDENDIWVIPHLSEYSGLNDGKEIYDYLYKKSTNVDVFSSTTATNEFKAVDDYIHEYASKSIEFGKVVSEISSKGSFDTWWDVINASDPDLEELFNDFFILLKKDLDHEKKINEFLYVYSYLWQENNHSDYDTYLTQKMKQNSFNFIWTFDFKDPKESFGIKGVNSGNPTSSAWSDYNDRLSDDATLLVKWNETIDEVGDIKKINSNRKSSVSNNGYKGFGGMVSKSSNIVVFNEYNSEDINQKDTKKFWTYDNIYDFSRIDEDYSSFTLKSEFGVPVIFSGTDGNYGFYQKIVTETGEDGQEGETETVEETKYSSYIKLPIYPFAFGLNYDETGASGGVAGVAEKWKYSLTAYKDSSDNYYLNNNESGTLEEVNFFELIAEYVGFDGDPSNSDDVEEVELFFIKNLLKSDAQSTTSITDMAYSYWRARGFYIKLSGKYKKDYSSLIPNGIQKR